MSSRKLMTLFVLVALLASVIPAGVALAKKGPPVSETNNNLSFPVIWSEGAKLTLAGTMLGANLTKPYDVTQDGIITDADMLDCGGTQAYAYAQKTVGNTWQAENVAATEAVYISQIDWGDSLESQDMKVGRPVRVELSLYKLLDTPLTGYTMVMLANPSSPDEVQGACAFGDPAADNGAAIVSYPSSEATVYSPYGKLLIQKITCADDLTWNGVEWISGTTCTADASLSVSFAGELNVGGKVIYGLSTGGWKPTELGDYRITFYLDPTKNTFFDANTTIRQAVETETAAITPAEEGGDVGGEAVVDTANNLTYIDITVVGGGK